MLRSFALGFKQRRQRRKREAKKATGLNNMQNNNSARGARFFVTARRRHENASFHVFWKT